MQRCSWYKQNSRTQTHSILHTQRTQTLIRPYSNVYVLCILWHRMHVFALKLLFWFDYATNTVLSACLVVNLQVACDQRKPSLGIIVVFSV